MEVGLVARASFAGMRVLARPTGASVRRVCAFRGRGVGHFTRAATTTEDDGGRDDGDDSSPSGASAFVDVIFRGEKIGTARRGQKLRSAILRCGATPHNGDAKLINCRGLGTCGTCAVEVIPPDAVEPRQWTAMERARLNFPPHGAPGNARLRLACQVRLAAGDSCAPGGGGVGVPVHGARAVEGGSAAREAVEVVKRSKFWGQGDEVLGYRRGRERRRGQEVGAEEAAAASKDLAAREGSVTPLGALEFMLDPDEWPQRRQ